MSQQKKVVLNGKRCDTVTDQLNIIGARDLFNGVTSLVSLLRVATLSIIQIH
jgi:hypothetical protein